MFRSTRTVVILTTLFAATVALADEKGDKPNSADVMKLQGEWVASEGFEADMTMVIKGNKFALKDGERAVEGTFTIDAAKSPKTMDLTVTGGSADREVEQFKGKTSQAIYTVDDKQFKWCASEPGKDARPAEFARGDALYIVFERKSADE